MSAERAASLDKRRVHEILVQLCPALQRRAFDRLCQVMQTSKTSKTLAWPGCRMLNGSIVQLQHDTSVTRNFVSPSHVAVLVHAMWNRPCHCVQVSRQCLCGLTTLRRIRAWWEKISTQANSSSVDLVYNAVDGH